jgi:hypothetical protein
MEKESASPPKEFGPKVEIKDTNPPGMQNLESGTKTSDTLKEQDPLTTPGKGAKQIGQPIASVTPLQSTQGSVGEGWIFDEDLRPIREEELPPNEFLL